MDLKRFIEGFGYEPIFSEDSKFPVNPQSSNFENCIDAVRSRADIFVLIVGNRYGTQTTDGRSITNLEYEEAKAKGIPIYTFIKKDIINNLSIWEQNKDGNFSSVVDTPKLFQFANELRSDKRRWVFPFEEAAQIMDVLRAQWATLFFEALEYRARLQSAALPPELANLPTPSLRILLEKPPMWEAKFFGSVLRNEMESLSSLRRDIKYSLAIRGGPNLNDDSETMQWIGGQFRRAIRLSEAGKSLATKALKEAMGPPGVPANPEMLVYVAQRFGHVVRRMMEWKLEFLDAKVEDKYERLFQIVAKWCDEAIEKLTNLPDAWDGQIAESEEADKRGEKKDVFVQITLGSPLSPEFEKEMRRLGLK